MANLVARSKSIARRSALRDELWPGRAVQVWDAGKETGYAKVPRSLPLLLRLLQLVKQGSADPGPTYLDILCRHKGEGIVEITSEADCAYSAGFSGPRATRSWRERMLQLRQAEFVDAKPKGAQEFGYILLMHPVVILAKHIAIADDALRTAFQALAIDSKSTSDSDLKKRLPVP